MSGRLLILGAGALAREIALAIPAVLQRYPEDNFVVLVAGRDRARAEWIAQLVRARSFASGVTTLSAISYALDWQSVDQVANVITEAAPTVILNTASFQSAWSLSTDNAWSRLIHRGGYGVTAALQAACLPKLARAMRSASTTAPLVNACYPDVINAGCARMGLNVICGVGNVALLAELFRQHLSHTGLGRLRVLAGHFDVNQYMRAPERRRDFPIVWRDDCLVTPSSYAYAPSLPGDASMNSFSAGASAALLHAVASNHPWVGHAPGPLGELGGYPIEYRDGEIRVDLPKGESMRKAQQWNRDRCDRDGATVEDGHLRFSASVCDLLRDVAPDLAQGFSFADAESAAQAFLELRSALSARHAA